MKISTKGRYALRVMIDIAIHSNGRCVSIKEIAGRQEISEKYLDQIFTVLSRSGLLRSTRGAQGGYTLTRDPEDYTVGMILRALEGDLAPVDCVAQGQSGSGPCPRAEQCVTWEVWAQIRDAVNGVVDHITLAELVRRYRDKLELQQEGAVTT